MVNTFPATLMVVFRAFFEGLCDMEYVTVPLPVPALPEVMVTQFALLAACHPQPVPALTLMLPVAPEAGIEALVGEME
jgi:hypothetical protein